MAQKLPNKDFYERVLLMIKMLPILIAVCYVTTTALCMFDVDSVLMTHIKEFFYVYYLYIGSYLFQLCWRYRMFIHYIVICDVLNLYDTYVGLPISNIVYCQLLICIAGVVLVILVFPMVLNVAIYLFRKVFGN